MNGTLTDIPGIRVGHAHDLDNGPTGCTVILCSPGTTGGVDQRGGAPGTRETDLLRPMHMVEYVHGIFLAGGSAFGLAVGDGVMGYLEEHDIGHQTPVAKVPIVPGAILFDLDVGNPARRPDAEMGYAACKAATDNPVEQGCVGAGAGAIVGRLMGSLSATKSGIGSASIKLGDNLVIAALFAVNAAWGDIVDERGNILAGARVSPDSKQFANAMELLKMQVSMSGGQSTVIGVVATNAALSKEDVNKMAQMAQDGLARAVRPAHTPFDGDTIFALATGTQKVADMPGVGVSIVGAFAAEVTAQAIRNAVLNATSLAGVPAIRSFDENSSGEKPTE